jgi:DNA-binding transcriptional LysR family regulator
MALSFGMHYLLPLVPDLLRRYPGIRIDWQFDNRQVDLIAEGFDAAIGAGFELSPGVVARPLAPAHVIAVTSPAYMQGRKKPVDPEGLAALDGICMRSSRTGRIRHWTMRNAAGRKLPVEMREQLVFNDPAAMTRAAVLGLGVAMIAVPDALPYLESGALMRLVPNWYADAGPISLYYSNRTLLPAKTRAFVDFVVEAFARERLAERFAGIGAEAPVLHRRRDQGRSRR